jgi:DNA-binding NtrC family response regulator
VSRMTVLLVGRGTTVTRLRMALKRHGLRVKSAADCGSALEALRGEAPSVVALDAAGAGYAAEAFTDMLRSEHPTLPLVEIEPDGGHRAEDLSAVVARVEQAALLRVPEPEAEGEGAGPAGEGPADGGGDAPIEGYKFEDLTSRNARMLELFDLIPRVARTDSPILIQGETGTGKELIASAVHRQSRRREGPFFTVNCGAMTDSLLESELFGHEKGAFTGAYRRKEGYFELATKGTLFLDELGTISPAMQVKLLRVLERMEVRRVGGGELTPVDVRIVAATNARLEDAVAGGTFREDLYYRINVVQLVLPPLRERTEDIPVLADLFRAKLAQKLGRTVTGFERHAVRLLREYPWPGNVRELQNVVERAVILTTGPLVHERDLPERLKRAASRKTPVPNFDVDETLESVIGRIAQAVEREYLRRVLRKYHGHIAQTAQHAGLNRRTLYNKMRVYGLKRDDFR